MVGGVRNTEYNFQVLIGFQESPHEHQQSLLLSRIITNVVWADHQHARLQSTSTYTSVGKA